MSLRSPTTVRGAAAIGALLGGLCALAVCLLKEIVLQ